MSASKTLAAAKRETTNTGSVRKLRNEGKVPAIIYGNKKPEVKVSIDEKELTLAYVKGGFFAKTIELDLGKEKIKVLPQEIQFHPVKDNPVHADFLRVDDNTKVKVSIPVKFSGMEKSPGLKRGGVLNAVRRVVEVYCAVKDIPEAFNADVSEMKIGDNIRFSNLNAPASVKPVIKGRNFTIASIAGRVAKDDGEQTTEVAATEDKEKAAE